MSERGRQLIGEFSDRVDASSSVFEDLTELRRSLAGTVLAPGDSGYESARRCFNLLIDRRPAVIARCVHADDVATAFDFARSHTLQVDGYVNYMQADEPIERVRAAFSDRDFARLQALKG